MKFSTLLVLSIIFFSCSNDKKVQGLGTQYLFEKLTSKKTGVTFINKLTESDSLNYFKYSSIYMGGGVAVGDINNDGLKDLFFSGNQVENKLYLNKGGLDFEDITSKSRIGGDHRWYSGVTMVDVNADGLLDVYCSVSGLEGNKENQLYINNGNLTFSEKAREYGLNDPGNTTQATFFDYDNDGDLDVYLVNYPIANVDTPIPVFKNRMNNPDLKNSDKLYRNDGGIFTDVSSVSGIKNYGFGLSASAADLNNDGWLDLYVSNDYSIPDFFYLNNGNGTFKEVVKEATYQTSFYGMGVDVADINNDTYLDIFQVDMDAEDNRRSKANMASMNTSFFKQMVMNDFHHQYMHNCLQLNTGIVQDSIPKFSNISRLAGVSSTDWSWGPLFADFDNDGFKDLFITNGTRREVMNKDIFKKINSRGNKDLTDLEKVELLPVEKIDNYVFKNNGNLGFEKVNKKWGLEYKGFSNGATYADLDNDGDLEIIINNLDDDASIFENKSDSNLSSNYIQITLQGYQLNKFGLGSRVYLEVNGERQMQELTLSRGFQSSVSPEIHFGLGESKVVDQLKVVWPDNSFQIFENVNANQKLIANYKNAENNKQIQSLAKNQYLFNSNVHFPSASYSHKENPYDDFRDQVLLPHKMSAFGPAITVADFNADNLEDFFVGGSKGNEGLVFFQKEDGFFKKELNVFKFNKGSEDVHAVALDVDNDGDQDLYVASGGYEFEPNSLELKNKLYINDGVGNFSVASNSALPDRRISCSKVYKADFDQDGREDLLVLGRQVPKNYPASTDSYLLQNISENGNPKFKDVTSEWIKEFNNLGMATSAVITDFNNDNWLDIIVVGEWMPIRIFQNIKSGFKEISYQNGFLKQSMGWWWSIAEGDFDNDGDMDYLVGNNGLNYKYKATEEETFDMYVNDFDKNKKNDIVLSYYNGGEKYPLRGRQCSSEQIPNLQSKFKDYASFSEATLEEVYSKKALDASTHYQIKSFASVYLENNQGTFKIKQLPIEAQFSAQNQILVEDFNGDGNLDAVLAGNLFVSEVETPRNDGGFGTYLKGNGKGEFESVPSFVSGLYIPGDVKNLSRIKIKGKDFILAVKNNDFIQFIQIDN